MISLHCCERCDEKFHGWHNSKFCDPCKPLARQERNNKRQAERWLDPQEREVLKANARNSRANNLESINKKAREKSASVKRFVDTIKTTCGCVDCGYNARAIALDFDHLPEFEKTQIVAHCKTIRRAVEEIEKCEVVCAVCHRIRGEDRGTFGHRN